jgi:signal transduction histidine kinase
MVKKSEPTMASLDINEALGEFLALLGSEFHRRNVMLEAQLSADIGRVMGDRVQLQQVILNLVMNGIESMNTIEDRPRLLQVRSQRNQSGEVLIAVSRYRYWTRSRQNGPAVRRFFHRQSRWNGHGIGSVPPGQSAPWERLSIHRAGAGGRSRTSLSRVDGSHV